MQDKSRILALMARRSAAQAARAGSAAAAARDRAEKAARNHEHLTLLAQGLVPRGPLTAALLRDAGMLATDLASEATAQGERARLDAAEAGRHQIEVARHELRRASLEAAAHEVRLETRTAQEARAELARPGRPVRG